MKTRLAWNGSLEAQRQYEEAVAKLPPRKPKLSKKAKRKAADKAKRRFVSYDKYLKSGWWKRRRLKAISAAGFKCERCGIGDRLQVHHKHYRTLFMENNSDLTVLCGDCHASHHLAEVFGVDQDNLERYMNEAV